MDLKKNCKKYFIKVKKKPLTLEGFISDQIMNHIINFFSVVMLNTN